MLLVKCHALCDPNGLGYKLSNASASPEQCTIDCAASLVHGELFSSGGRQNRTQNASRLLRQTKDDASEHGKLSQAQVLLKPPTLPPTLALALTLTLSLTLTLTLTRSCSSLQPYPQLWP